MGATSRRRIAPDHQISDMSCVSCFVEHMCDGKRRCGHDMVGNNGFTAERCNLCTCDRKHCRGQDVVSDERFAACRRVRRDEANSKMRRATVDSLAGGEHFTVRVEPECGTARIEPSDGNMSMDHHHVSCQCANAYCRCKNVTCKECNDMVDGRDCKEHCARRVQVRCGKAHIVPKRY